MEAQRKNKHKIGRGINEFGQTQYIVNVGNSKKYRIPPLSTTRIIVLGFVIIIFIGSCLLSMPQASNDGHSIGFLNAFFTATSATCVTGLSVAPTITQWSLFGQLVILALIQVGGLGFVTLVSMVFLIAGKKITLKERMLLHESLNQNFHGQAKIMVMRIIIGTLAIEALGAIILTIRFLRDFNLGKSMYMGIFHSISAFCNAGFDIISDSSLMPYAGDPVINIVLMVGIVIGGIGFTVWFDVIKIAHTVRKTEFKLRYCIKNLSLHSKLVLTITPIFIVGGAILFFVMEYSNSGTIGDMSFGDKILAALFQSVTTRTAGFSSIDQGGLTDGSKFLSVILMLIGGSPGGTAGGIKTVTIAIMVLSVISVIQGRSYTYCFKRRIPFYTLQKALAVFFLNLLALCAVTGLLTITESELPGRFTFIDIFYETASALGTVGLTTGVTPYLSAVGKIIIALCMFMGRIGPVTIALALAKRQVKPSAEVQYPEEEVIVG